MKRARPVVYVPDVFRNAYNRKWTYLVVFVVVYFFSFSFLSGIGFAPSAFRIADIPSYVVPTTPETDTVAVASGEGKLPIRIEVPEVGIKASVSNPSSTNIDTLNNELLAGAVRYPGTGVPGEKGNVLLFGHSSHLPVVHNQSYKAFNGIETLKEGDPIYIYGDGTVYTYAVESVHHENTATDAIPLSTDGAKLTLATCDNFGEKSDRWIVTAGLVAVAPAK
jgi:LPXTG-site transpeptidase (sortase) family protein